MSLDASDSLIEIWLRRVDFRTHHRIDSTLWCMYSHSTRPTAGYSNHPLRSNNMLALPAAV